MELSCAFLFNMRSFIPGFVDSAFLVPMQHEEPEIANGQFSTRWEKMLSTGYFSSSSGQLVGLSLS